MMPRIATAPADASARARPPGTWRRDRRFALFLALSLLVHGIALYELKPRLKPVAFDDEAPRGAPLVARVEPPRIAVSEAAATKPSPPRVAKAQPRPAPRVLDGPSSPVALPSDRLARVPDTTITPLQPAPPLPAPSPSQPTAENYPDLASYVAARRRARGEPAEGFEDDNARRDRLVAQNLAPVNAPTFGSSHRSGGLFQITRLGYDDAEFTFFGWHSEIKRRAQQRIEVRRGGERDIRIAVVRRMIAIIREYEQEDFTWRSNRLGRDITLSARVSDTAGLEDFLMREFFF